MSAHLRGNPYYKTISSLMLVCNTYIHTHTYIQHTNQRQNVCTSPGQSLLQDHKFAHADRSFAMHPDHPEHNQLLLAIRRFLRPFWKSTNVSMSVSESHGSLYLRISACILYTKYLCMYVCMYVCMHVMYACVYIYVYNIYVYIHIYINIYIYIYIYIYTHTYTHIYMYVPGVALRLQQSSNSYVHWSMSLCRH
jgi:hypothetical protein